MLDNRELATLILVGCFVLLALSNKSVRDSFVELVKLFLKPQILVPFVLMFAWVGLELWVGSRLGVWNSGLAKGTILWTLGAASVLLVNCSQVKSDPKFYRRTLIATVGVVAFVEFYMNLYVLNLLLELVLQMVVVVPSFVVAVGETKQEYKSAKVFCQRVLALIGIGLFIFVARQIYLDWHLFDLRDLMLEFGLPIWLTAGLLPFLYVFSIYIVYDLAIRRINSEASNRWSNWRSRLALLSVLHLRKDAIRKLTGYRIRLLCEAQSFSAARSVVAEFLDELRRAKQATIDEEERLRRYSGSQELDENGRRLDRREFAATIDALRWLATCQMGWHSRRGGSYRSEMLEILGDDFTRQGLPEKSGIKLHVAQDGQSWYAWRRTVTGWCFAIAAAGPPPDQWQYDGPEPPTGFPGKDYLWGDSPFANQVDLNWS